jgi:acyl dehydratase
MRRFAVGDQLVHERSFAHQDVLAFTRISGDAGAHHVTPGPDGRLLVHGLLTATIPTKLGGDIDYLAREMVFEFLRPVYTGDTIRCVMTVQEVDEQPGKVRLRIDGACTNQRGEVVLSIKTRGVVRRDLA